MINPQLTNTVIASLKAAGITPPKLRPIQPFPMPVTSTQELIEAVVSSDHEDPYTDPAVTAIASTLYIQSLGGLDQTHRQLEMERRARELESHKDDLLDQIRAAFEETAALLTQDAEPIKGVEDPLALNPNTSSHSLSTSATDVIQGLKSLEAILKAWRDLWGAIGGNGYGVDRGKPFTFMNPNAEKWEDLRRNPTIWEAIRNDEPLTLADSPEHVSQRYQAMINNEQASMDNLREDFHAKNGAAMLKSYQGN